MNTLVAAVMTGIILALSSCGTVRKTAAQAGLISEPKLRLTKADPKRFLPPGTSADSLGRTRTDQRSQLLAKHTPRNSKTSPRAADPLLPPLDLPPLPEADTSDEQEYAGILPSIDNSGAATFIDVEGATPELPPLEISDFEEESGNNGENENKPSA